MGGVRSGLLSLLARTGILGPAIAAWRSDLRARGWFASVKQGQAIDERGDPTLWMTYPFIDFLTPRVRAEWSVFEYGAGNSTRWWSKRVARVASAESDAAWVAKLAPQLGANCAVRHIPLDDTNDYERAGAAEPGAFDLIAIDGRRRVRCAKACLPGLKPTGVVVWDNTDRAEYADGMAHLAAQGFKRLDFWGMGPIVGQRSCTSVFYRQPNCLDI